MPELGRIVEKVRSKNAGPFWLTVDIFCGTPEVFARVVKALSNDVAGACLQLNSQEIKRFEIAELNVLKLSFPRPETQGAIADRDMHGAAIGALLSEVEV